MKKNNLTLALYGIQDLWNSVFPVYLHDHNLTVYRNGEILNYLALERYTRAKYDSRLPIYLYHLLKEGKLLGIKGIDLVFVDSVIGRSFISRQGNIRFEAPLNSELNNRPERGEAYYLDKKREAWTVNHELAHVFTNLPFYGPFKENSLHVHFDGGASKSNFSAWHFTEGKLNLVEYHWDLQWLSSLFNANALTFSLVGAKQENQNSMPGKFMGYAAYGRYHSEIEKWLKANDFFKDIWGRKKYFFDRLYQDWGKNLRNFDQNDPFLQDIAATIQNIFIRELLNKLSSLQRSTGAEYLYYTGGSALNIKANTSILKSGLFRDVFIPPCANDAGLSLGAGALVEWIKHGSVRKQNPYLNNWFLNDYQIKYTWGDLSQVARHLYEGKVVAVINGNGEVGPRALGNRSILARADSEELSRYVSRKLKQREWYRPVAPVMLEKNLSHFTSFNFSTRLSKYMLMDFEILQESVSEIKGAVHVDGTSRIQTISEYSQNPFLFDLLSLLEKDYGLRVLLNTSFNAKGRPVVHTIKDAYDEAGKMGISYLVVNGRFRRV
jgi:carbamoyltransferase